MTATLTSNLQSHLLPHFVRSTERLTPFALCVSLRSPLRSCDNPAPVVVSMKNIQTGSLDRGKRLAINGEYIGLSIVSILQQIYP